MIVVISLNQVVEPLNVNVIDVVSTFPPPAFDPLVTFIPSSILVGVRTTVRVQGSYFTSDLTGSLSGPATFNNFQFLNDRAFTVDVLANAPGAITANVNNHRQETPTLISSTQAIEAVSLNEPWIDFSSNGQPLTIGNPNSGSDIEINPNMTFSRDADGLSFQGENNPLALIKLLQYPATQPETIQIIVKKPLDSETFASNIFFGLADDRLDFNYFKLSLNTYFGFETFNGANEEGDRISRIFARGNGNNRPNSLFINQIVKPVFQNYKIKIENNAKAGSKWSIFGINNISPANFDDENNLINSGIIPRGFTAIDSLNYVPFISYVNNTDGNIKLKAIKLSP